MARRTSLARQITIAVVGYALLLSAALFTHGVLVNENAERMVWQALLDTQLREILERRRQDPGYAWRNNGRFDLHPLDDPRVEVPDVLRPLTPGLHDSIFYGDNEWAVLVRDTDDGRQALALDIDGFEDQEWVLMRPVLASSLLMLLLLGVATYFGARLLTRPLRDLAARIGALSPDRHGQRIELPPRASTELAVIASALDDYLARNEQFVDRERAFIDTASHELRTPLSVIRSASQIALSGPRTPDAMATQLARIARTTQEVEHLISVLLVLAKDPTRALPGAERLHLDALLPRIVDDHRPLAAGKDLQLVVDALAPTTLVAPEAVVRIAIGNLVRNAIEHSDRGTIHISLEPGGRMVIRDPGHGMTPEEISALYARLARGGERSAGIGLALIARLSEHLGWQLDIDSDPAHGTVARLRFPGAAAALPGEGPTE
ncbi:sensor histidine kinase [Luteimonas sp. WGS1318]|uniref:sensor histidine kinase n=1 Tax=Luteimonas sp. WGS1318 TaxID=3366815 RepID=UPI00372D6ED2